MRETEVIFMEKPVLKNSVLIEGLPGIGYVGRNAAGYLVKELKAKKFAELFSPHFPPVVLMDHERSGKVQLLKNEFYYLKAKKKDDYDLIFLIGESQSMDPVGHYEISNTILDVAEEFKVKEIITLGGFGTGQLSETKSSVFGASADTGKIKDFEKLGVKFRETNIGQIIGASGLLIGLGHKRGIEGVCLMGETSGMLLSDPKATESVLEILVKYLNLDVDMTKINERIKETEKMIKKLEDLQKAVSSSDMSKKHKDDVGYIG